MVRFAPRDLLLVGLMVLVVGCGTSGTVGSSRAPSLVGDWSSGLAEFSFDADGGFSFADTRGGATGTYQVTQDGVTTPSTGDLVRLTTVESTLPGGPCSGPDFYEFTFDGGQLRLTYHEGACDAAWPAAVTLTQE